MDAVEGGHASRKQRLSRLVVAIMSCVIAMSGCRAATEYKPKDLPASLLAPRGHSPRQVDLSQIAQQSINQDLIYPGDVLDVAMASGVEDKPPQTYSVRVDDQGLVDLPLVGLVEVGGMDMVAAEQVIRHESMQREIYTHPHVSVAMKQRKSIQVRVMGAVTTPGVFSLPAAGSDLLSALVAAGGLTEKAGTLIEVRHPNSLVQPLADRSLPGVRLASFVNTPDQPDRTIRVDLTQLSDDHQQHDLHVEDGSIVMVKEREERSVSVIGLVKRPDSYELPDGEEVRVLDALAMAGGLTVSVADKVRVIRQPPGDADPALINVSIRKAKRSAQDNLVLAPGDVVMIEETPTTVVVDTIRGFFRFGFTGAIPGL